MSSDLARATSASSTITTGLTSCPMCGGTTLRRFGLAPPSDPPEATLHGAQAQCADCQLLISEPRTAQAALDAYYRHEYYDKYWTDAETSWNTNCARHLRVTMPALNELAGDWLDGVKSVLEVGCGYGALLHVLRQSRYRAVGIDASLSSAAFGARKGVPVVVGTAPRLPVADAAFDLVIARHVIEHVADPASFTASLARAVRPGGVIAVETENLWTSQYAWDRLRYQATGRQAPFRSSSDHTFVFQARHLQMLLQAVGCAETRVTIFNERPEVESLHWRLYKGLFRGIDRLTGMGEFQLAVGRKA